MAEIDRRNPATELDAQPLSDRFGKCAAK